MHVRFSTASSLVLLCSSFIAACTNVSTDEPRALGSVFSELPAGEIDYPDDEPEPDPEPEPEPEPDPEPPPDVPNGPGPIVLDGGVLVDETPVCPISWRPNALAPVFYGYRDYGPAEGAPVPMRVFFPSLDGSPQYGEFLANCGRYPVILFAHGQCVTDANPHHSWMQLPAQLARSGYVVIVPSLPSMSAVPSPSHPALSAMDGAIQWVRQTWAHRSHVMPNATGVAGHSYGGLLAAEFARTRVVSGYAALGADWHSWSGTWPIFGINKPKLVIWGSGENYSQLSPTQFDALSFPKHRGIFTSGAHWDYLPAGASSCHPTAGSCTLIPAASADLLTMFFAKHMPPEAAPELPSRVPANLFPPVLSLTFEQQFYAGGHLYGMRAMGGTSCGYELTGQLTPPPPPPTLQTVPDVRDLGTSAARSLVLGAGLKPVFSGSGTWVYSQSPRAGTQVAAGSTVTMTLRSGPRP